MMNPLLVFDDQDQRLESCHRFKFLRKMKNLKRLKFENGGLFMVYQCYISIFKEESEARKAAIKHKQDLEGSSGRDPTCLTFLCDELLSSALVRKHIEQCTDAPTKLMQNGSTSAELKTLKHKEENLDAKAVETDRSFQLLGSNTQQDSDKYIIRNYSLQSKSDCIVIFSGDLFQSNRDQTNAACYSTPDKASSEDLQGLSSSLAIWRANVGASDPIMFLNISQSDNSELTSVRTYIPQRECGNAAEWINESNKELVKDIGLVSSNGIPMFVPSISPHLSDSMTMLLPQEVVIVEADKFFDDEQLHFSRQEEI